MAAGCRRRCARCSEPGRRRPSERPPLTATRRAGGPLPWLGGLLVVYLAVPMAAFALRLSHGGDRGFGQPGLWSALGVSVQGATISLVLLSVLGVPLGHALARHRGRWSTVVGAVVQAPLALPPLMSGILLVFVVGPYSTLGRLTGGRLTQSLAGVVIAQSFVSAPFLVIAARSAFSAVDPALDELAATLGHRATARFLRVDLRCAAGAIRAGMVLTWLRAFGEYGATVIVAYHPFSLPIFTDNQFETAALSTTEAPTLLALAVAALVIGLGQARLPRRARPSAARRTGTAAAAGATAGAAAGAAAAGAAPGLQAGPAPSVTTPVGFALDARIGAFRLQAGYRAGSHRLAVVGPSGSGKTATLRGLAGLLGPRAGPVSYAGREVGLLAPEDRRVGYVPQGLGLLPGRTVWEQLVFGRWADPALAARWATTLHLDDLLDRYPEQLSGGQRQRVSLARALATEPCLLLLDEPFSALDAPVRDELRAELRRLQRGSGLSTVLVTHDPVEAAVLADEIVVLAAGRVLQAGAVPEVFSHPASLEVARLLGVGNVAAGTAAAGQVLLAGGVAVQVSAGVAAGLAPGSPVFWRVPPERVRVDRPERTASGTAAPGRYPAVVLDVVELGTRVELTVRLDGGPVLRVHDAGRSPVGAGQACLVELDPGDVGVWAAPATREEVREQTGEEAREEPREGRSARP